jgi:methylenetetrahydrofolate reductase (NADPH)
MSYDGRRLIREVHQEVAGDPLFAGCHTFNGLGRSPGLLDSLPRLHEATTTSPSKPSPCFLPRSEGKITWLQKPPYITSTSQG